ncbi:hypothetical protein QAD02_024000 [Eretmocerus hayati]|uniref:Uncharacterized protein n=1 Tax=Eretmocerus hayati TaxID=131215 RepID=A0ACC2PXS0_9HYME|nr:hypothetical protein QAD02_024000 [Eretmocerus hayati]
MSCTKDVGKLISRPPVYKWLIDDSCVRHCKNPGDSIESPLIEINTTTEETRRLWRLKFYPRGKPTSKDKDACNKYVPVQLVSYNRGKVEVNFDLASIQNDIVVGLYEGDRDIFQQIMWERGERFLSRKRVMKGDTGLLKNNNLTILCRIVLPLSEIVGRLDTELKECSVRDEKAVRSRKEDLDEVDCFARLIRDENFGDTTIKCKNGAFRVHAAVLESHSEVFTKMIKGKKKNKSDRVMLTLDDVDANVLKEILRFAYMGKVDSIQESGAAIFAAADKLGMKTLKSKCQKTMMDEGLTCKNAVERLRFADQYGLPDMKQQVIAFIALNSKKMYQDPSFVMMKDLKADLMYEVVEAIAKSKIES